jgi:hypothetical protein
LLSTPPPGDIPLARGTALFGLKASAEEMWGPSVVGEIARRLPAEARRAIEEIAMPSSWLPEDHILHWCRGVWEGPAQMDDFAFSAYLGRAAFHGWGRFRKALLGIATPDMLATRAPDLWRRDHTHGTVTTELITGGAITRLSGGPYVKTEFSRLVIAETFRHIFRMTRVKMVREKHALEPPDTLVIHWAWE